MHESALSHKEVERLLLKNYPRVAAGLLSGVVDLLIVARQHNGDVLDRALVMMVIALRTFMSPSFCELPAEAVLRGDTGPLPALGTNVSSIAQSTGIAKETVRRKVNDLIEEGLVVKEDARLSISPHAMPEFAAVRAQVVRLAALAHAAVLTATEAV